MRVAIVLNTSWNIYNFRMGLVRSLQDQGHEVYAVAPKDDYSQLLIDAGCIYKPIDMQNTGSNPVKDFKLIMRFRRIYQEIQPDVVLQYTIKPNIYGTFAARSLGIPIINNVCGLGTVFLKKTLVSVIAINLYRLAFLFPDKIFFQNGNDFDLFRKKWIVNPRKAQVIPGSGINLQYFKPSAKARKEEKHFTFLLISRLLTDKGILEYVEAIRRLKENGVDAKFQLLGHLDPGHKRGIGRETLEEWISNGLVDYLGTTKDVRGFIEAADCVVLPSYREGTPRTLLEAASFAKPIVATDVPGCNNVVTHNYNGFLCRLKDAADLADKMKQMVSISANERDRLGKNSRKMVEERFDEQLVIKAYDGAIQEIVPSRS